MAALLATCLMPLCSGGEKKPEAPKAKPRHMQMDYGPFLSASMMSDPKAKFRNGDGHFENSDVTPRGIAVKLAEEWMDGIVFDCDTLRYSAGWIGGTFKLLGVPFDGGHGPGPTLGVPPLFQTPHCPGWADKGGSFTDPRPDSIKPLPPPGPIPAAWGKYKGLYKHGKQVVFSYTIGSCNVLDMPAMEGSGDAKGFARCLTLSASDAALALMVCEVKGVAGTADGATASVGDVKVGLVGAPPGAKLVATPEGQIRLQIPQLTAAANFKVIITKADAGALVKASSAAINLTTLTKGGAPSWTEKIETKGVMAEEEAIDEVKKKNNGTATKEQEEEAIKKMPAYVVDRITIPFENPYKAWMRIGGFDFFANQTSAAMSTWSGDVWTVTGIEGKMENLVWKRIATGLHQPLGVRVVDEKIYVVGKDQITRLHDLNGDAEIDFYECFNHDWELTTAFHSFCYDLQTDKEGNFYFIFGAPVHAGGGGFQNLTAHHGCLMKVSKDGGKATVYATGFRSPNGIGISPDGQLTSSDNQGTWVPATPLHWIKPGSFNGVTDTAHGVAVSEPKPLCYMPQNVDNSGGGQNWVTSDSWGPFKGELLHLSYGQSALYKVLKEEVNGQVQGGVVKIPLKLTCSSMRSRFNTKDGQLYIGGLKGWQTNAAKDGGLDRVRYTNKPVQMPTGMKATTKGVEITFTDSLDPATANDPQNFGCEVWNYKWTSAYGSPQVSTLPEPPKTEGAKPEPKKKGDQRDPMTVKSSKLSADGKTVALEIENMRPVNQMKITYKLKAADGTDVKSEIHSTIHNLGK